MAGPPLAGGSETRDRRGSHRDGMRTIVSTEVQRCPSRTVAGGGEMRDRRGPLKCRRATRGPWLTRPISVASVAPTMRLRHRMALLVSATYVAGTLLVPILHSIEAGESHGVPGEVSVTCTHPRPLLQTPCPTPGPCDNPHHHHHHSKPGASAVPCPRCGGVFGPALDQSGHVVVPAAGSGIAVHAGAVDVRTTACPRRRTARAPPRPRPI